mmetsp:Transcript_29460/g.47356  ORF Transcript_29460/g.47356 Transcript_29460/m.47356 type:complete len:204 (-) Transcript_29460:198-809(-)
MTHATSHTPASQILSHQHTIFSEVLLTTNISLSNSASLVSNLRDLKNCQYLALAQLRSSASSISWMIVCSAPPLSPSSSRSSNECHIVPSSGSRMSRPATRCMAHNFHLHCAVNLRHPPTRGSLSLNTATGAISGNNRSKIMCRRSSGSSGRTDPALSTLWTSSPHPPPPSCFTITSPTPPSLAPSDMIPDSGPCYSHVVTPY